jgi:hypothetical protein
MSFGVVALVVIAGSAAGESAVSLLDQPAVFAAAVQTRFGQHANVFKVEIRDEGAAVEVQDPATPSHVDRYEFEEGALGAAEPVQVGRNQRAVNARLFPFGDVDLAMVPRLLPDARTRARTEDARVVQVTIERVEGGAEYTSWGRPQIHVMVNGPRGGAVVRYGLDGKHKGTNRW